MVISQSWGSLLLLFGIITLKFYEGVHEMGHPQSPILPVPNTEGPADRICTQQRGQQCVVPFHQKNRANENVFKLK